MHWATELYGMLHKIKKKRIESAMGKTSEMRYHVFMLKTTGVQATKFLTIMEKCVVGIKNSQKIISQLYHICRIAFDWANNALLLFLDTCVAICQTLFILPVLNPCFYLSLFFLYRLFSSDIANFYLF